MKKAIDLLLKILLFVVGLTLVVVFQKSIGYVSLGWMLVGLGMLLTVLYLYNQKFK